MMSRKHVLQTRLTIMFLALFLMNRSLTRQRSRMAIGSLINKMKKMNALKIENAKAEPKKKEQGAESNACQNQQQDCAPYLNPDIFGRNHKDNIG